MANREGYEGGRWGDDARRQGGGRDQDRDQAGRGEDRAFSNDQKYGRPGPYRYADQDRDGRRNDPGSYSEYGQYPQGVSRRDLERGRGDDYGQRRYGSTGGGGGFGEGGYPRQWSGEGGYGQQGFGPEHQPGSQGSAPRREFQQHEGQRSYGQGGGTYGQQDFSQAARRDQWREDQRYGDRSSTGETYGRGPSPSNMQGRDETYGGVSRAGQYGGDYQNKYAGETQGQGHEHDDHEPHYRRWRDEQLASHDRDYGRWRDEQARRYDHEYRTWRDQRHDSFARDFHDWRSRQSGQGGNTVQPGQAVFGDGDSPTGATGGASGLTGASTGARGAESGHSSPVTGVSDSGGGATGSAQISGGSGGVAGTTTSTDMGGAARAHMGGGGAGSTSGSTGSAQATRQASGSAGGITATAAEPVQNVTDGGSGHETKDRDERRDDDRAKKH